MRIRPRAVAQPGGIADLQSLIRFAAAEGCSLVPRGSATGMPGGNVGPGIVVDFQGEAFQGLDAIDVERGTVRAGVGVVLARVVDAARAVGLEFPPSPSSVTRCSVGGVAANNAAGARSFRHGSARPWIEDVEAVLSDGDLLRPGRSRPDVFGQARALGAQGAWELEWPRVRKNSSGYAIPDFVDTGRPSDLLVGSEGTLGLLTAVELRLRPLPAERRVAVLALPTRGALARVIDVASRLRASACEFLGHSLLQMGAVEADPLVGDMVETAWGLAIVEFEGTSEEVGSSMGELLSEARGLEIAARAGSDGIESRDLWNVRHRASPTIAARAGEDRVSMQFIEDSVVPPGRLPEYLAGLSCILSEARLEAVVFGHAGDGNVHVNPLVPTGDDDWRDRVRQVLEAVAELVASLEGTLSGEHGDGRIRAPLLDRIWGPGSVAAFKETKALLDPDGIFNPGVILPL
ncbi:MAG: FAD-binding oxidoreductase, partial [Gemmatimonadetes bacterium]|nr:FAD-binding oxidoreductase [Gemmatimonadota bacterium]